MKKIKNLLLVTGITTFATTVLFFFFLYLKKQQEATKATQEKFVTVRP